MTTLERNALACLTLTAAEVEAIYAEYGPEFSDTFRFNRFIRRLCESHERLRMELIGALSMIEGNET